MQRYSLRTLSPRGRWIAAAVVLALVLAAAAVIGLAGRSGDGGTQGGAGPQSSGHQGSGAQSEAPKSFSRPGGASQFRPSYHLTPAKEWMNDPQRPFLLDEVWHYYYLYNADHPEGNGTEWFHVTSTDLVHWKDEGVAIEKFKNGLGDIETGSAVVDRDNTAGFGKGAVVAIMTQQDKGVQRQSLFYSTDKGHTFKAADGNPVMENPGAQHWRDPKIIRDENRGQWVMALAEGEKIGLYTSKDLKDWRYVSDFERKGLGILECPDLFQLDVDGDPAKRTWVLAASANGTAEGRTTGVAYWTGTFDGTTFTPADDKHQWLDAGADFYAAVTWDDPRLPENERMASRHAIGWMNNWTYARQLPTTDWQGGADSIVRDIRLKTVQGRPTLVSTPIPALSALDGEAKTAGSRALTPEGAGELPAPAGGAYRLDVTLERAPGDDGTEALLKLGSGGADYARVGYNFEAGTAWVSRAAVVPGAEPLGPLFTERRSAQSPPRSGSAQGSSPGRGSVDLTVFVDYSSVEVFVNGGEQTLTSVVLPRSGQPAVSAATAGGKLTLKSFKYTPLATVLTAR
ncbi:glycoside hydrolase family 32 protein [Arthrobacter sp. ISL-65]|uniref:glycoside hydrolase family 32 protein n=1 Tax=Arthrobacter sp. ISL-65 TaxID=2819112 RepID=UPI001BE89C60|nr:glycoside hydrolase family 32 protein [Arthrobacter sp. ISL-65]MBT2549221.1 glycoside hydrolase family 32 protein [Arthrobacter sp. ISL-65]